MSKPQIILNAGCAAIAMAVAYRLANRALDSVLPKKKVEEEEPASARVLLDNGAEIGRADKDGRTPLVIACQEGNVAAARLWLACGAEIDRADKDGRTPLYIACQVGHVEAARLLLAYGAEIDRANKDGRTPLYIACQEGHVDAARLLLEKGAAVDRAAKRGTTPLFAACFIGHVDAVRLLLEKGASVHAPADNGETPLDVAKRRQHHRVIVLLEESLPLALPLAPPRLGQRQQSDVQCSICLGPYKERAWTKCNHSFCRKCIMQVCLTNYPTNRAPCPFCRQPVLLGELARRPGVADAIPHEPERRGFGARFLSFATAEPTSGLEIYRARFATENA